MSHPFWRRCSSCKSQIAFGARYWTCSVSTCNRKGTDFVFCSVPCWEIHVPTLRHREAWAVEQQAPAPDVASASQAGSTTSASALGATEASGPAGPDAGPSQTLPRRRIVVTPAAAGGAGATAGDKGSAPRGEVPHDILIVASKLKAYIRARSGMNTSESVLAELSDRVRALCDDAITRAREAGRKTVMDRDF